MASGIEPRSAINLTAIVLAVLGTTGTALAATVDCNKGEQIGPAVAAAVSGERIVG